MARQLRLRCELRYLLTEALDLARDRVLAGLPAAREREQRGGAVRGRKRRQEFPVEASAECEPAQRPHESCRDLIQGGQPSPTCPRSARAALGPSPARRRRSLATRRRARPLRPSAVPIRRARSGGTDPCRDTRAVAREAAPRRPRRARTARG